MRYTETTRWRSDDTDNTVEQTVKNYMNSSPELHVHTYLVVDEKLDDLVEVEASAGRPVGAEA